MKKHKSKELMMLPLLFVVIALCIGGHFIYNPAISKTAWQNTV